MDIEFRVVGYGHSTTNSNCQYRVMKTIGFIYRDIVDNSDNQLDNITFKSSYLRDGKTDINAGVVRTNFFIRFLKSLYPNARIFENSGGVIRADITYPWVN